MKGDADYITLVLVLWLCACTDAPYPAECGVSVVCPFKVFQNPHQVNEIRNKTQWEKQYSGTYIEDKSESNDYQVICYLKIEEDEHRSLGDFLKAEININTDEVLMIAPANECICYHVDN